MTHPIHPAVTAAWNMAEPSEAETLGMENPGECQESPRHGNVAYYRASKDAEGNARMSRVFGKLGKYLARHFPSLQGHEIQSLVDTYNASLVQSEYRIVPLAEMIELMIQTGDNADMPRSCMTKGRWSPERHPYRVYSPQWGWEHVCRFENGKLKARALTNKKNYVKVYGPCDGGGYSNQEDAGMFQYLADNGYTRISSWSGFTLEMIERDDRILLPYIDGGCQSIDQDGEITHSGCYSGRSTDGWVPIVDENEGMVQLENGDWVEEEEATYLEYRYDGRRYEGYWHSDDCTWVGNRVYLDEHVVHWNGETYFIGNCTELRSGEWAPDDECVETIDGDIELFEECVETPEGWILADDAVEMPDGTFQHEDAVIEMDGIPTLKDDCVIDIYANYILKAEAISLGYGWAHESICIHVNKHWHLKKNVILTTAGPVPINSINRLVSLKFSARGKELVHV